MRIQKLEIQGFKSFADRTTIQFGNGITGVVGPNGCGKSNIVDAIRWVMGEMSPRHLRGGSMQDVIFNGSDSRGPMGMAEVTLTFENNGQGAPVDYQQFAEIQVTRRLFRDGDSDYEINKTPCRLKDIHDLFAGSGLGKSAYSIVSQGQVSEIMRAKPEERRRIIEEAAGITKYKARKDAAVRKMEATRSNLQRIDDVTTEIGRRLGSLRRQAKKAERYKELKSEAREIELHQVSMRFLELTNAIGFDRDAYNALTSGLSGEVERVAAVETDIDARRERLTEAEKRLSSTQARLYEVESSLLLNEQTAETAKRDIERSIKRDEEAAVECGVIREQRAVIAATLQDLESGQASLEQEMTTDTGALDGAQRELDAERKARNDDAAAVEDLRKQVIGCSTDAAKLASDVVNLKTSLEEMHKRQAQLLDEKTPVTEELARAKTQCADSEQERTQLDADKASLESERVGAQQQQAETKKRFDEARRAHNDVTTALQKKKGRLVSLEEIHARYEQSPEAVRDLLKRGGPLEGKGKLLVDLFDAPSDIETALEAALGQRLQAVLVSDEDSVKTAVEHLEGNKKGRAEILLEAAVRPAFSGSLPGAQRVLDVVTLKKKASDAVGALLSRIFVVDTAEQALALLPLAQADNLTIATRQGTVFEPYGGIKSGTGGDQGVLKQKREMRELAAEVEAMDIDAADKLRSVEDLDAALKSLDESLVTLTERGSALSLKLVEVKGLLKRASEDTTRLEKRLAKLEDDEKRADVSILQAQSDLDDRMVRLRAAEALRTTSEAELQTRSATLVEIDASIARKQDLVTTLKVRAASVAERREMYRKNVEGAARQAEDLLTRLERLEKQITDGHGERQELTTVEAQARALLATLGQERTELRSTLDEVKKQTDQAGEQVRVLDHEARAARQALDAARSKHAGLQVRIRERELELDAIVDRTIERHRITPQEALYDYHMRELPAPELEGRLAELERAIDNLGAINLTAIDECKELDERHVFLRTQADDLTHALNQLEKAIVKINRTTRKRFQETFDGISERFQQVFPRLFRGGKAWLALTDPNDLLTTGVEIYAQPPGKKLGSVALMSGGEQALTAVSLLFSIFLMKPSPFCLLDEVDAPLDEANVGRFNDMVRDISAISQFIVITHNKKTMEVADQLYGVTMQEPGISKTVNVRIQ